MSKRKRQDNDDLSWERSTKPKISCCLEDLPDELLFNILVAAVILGKAQPVCHRWHQIMDQEFARQLCFARWGRELCTSFYEKSDDEAKLILLQDYFIPVANGKVDWKRYYHIRSLYDRLLRHYEANEVSFERAPEIKEIHYIEAHPSGPFVASSLIYHYPAFTYFAKNGNSKDLDIQVIKRGFYTTSIGTLEEADYLTQLYCELIKLDVEQEAYWLDVAFFNQRTWDDTPNSLPYRARNYEHCLSLLKLYYFAGSKNRQDVQNAVLCNVLACYLSSLYEYELFNEIFNEILKQIPFMSDEDQNRLHSLIKYELRSYSTSSNDFCAVLMRVFERAFEKGNAATKQRILTLLMDVRNEVEEKLFQLLLEHINTCQDDTELLEFVPRLKEFVFSLEDYESDVNSDLAYAQIIRVALKPSVNLSVELMAFLVEHLTQRRAQSMFTTIQLNLLFDLSNIASAKETRLSQCYFENLPLFGKRLEPYLATFRHIFVNKHAREYMKYTLLTAYPDEAANVVIDMIKTKPKKFAKKIFLESDLLEQCLGDQFDSYKNELIDAALSYFPELVFRRLTVLSDSEHNNVTLDQLPAGQFDRIQSFILRRLVIFAQEHQLDQTRQYHILNLALMHLKAMSDPNGLWDRIQNMPILDQVTEETLPYYLAIFKLAPQSGAIYQKFSCVIMLITKYPSIVLSPTDPLNARQSIIISTHIACYYGLKTFLEAFYWPEEAAMVMKAMFFQATHYLAMSSIEDKFYNIVRLFSILTATSFLDSRIEQFTCHEHDWDLVLAALNHSTVQGMIGTQYAILTKQDLDDYIPQYFKNFFRKDRTN